MTDIALELLDDGRSFAAVLYRGDLIRDDSLRPAVLASLFVDREATPEQLLAAGFEPTDRRGCWADALATVAGDRMGSHLWLLERRKQRPDVLPEAKRYAEAALAWLVADGVASAVTVAASYSALGELLLDIAIAKPSGREQYRVGLVWAANFAKTTPIQAAEGDAATAAAAAAAIENIWYVEIPEITE